MGLAGAANYATVLLCLRLLARQFNLIPQKKTYVNRRPEAG
jgi:hypothetical protein